jgi:SAM-dependent methyltransferase
MNILNRLWFSISYFRRPPWDSGVTPPELLAFLEDRPPGRAIDLGCGTGTNVITLASYGWQVTGVDFVPAAIKQARGKARLAGVTADFQVGDVTRLDRFAGPYELALDIGCFHSLSEKGKMIYMRQVDKLLVPGGFWFLYGFLTEFSPPGIFPSDIDAIRGLFRMISYKDGFDRGQRPSAYFTLQKT